MKRNILFAMIAIGLAILSTGAVSQQKTLQEQFGEVLTHGSVERSTNEGSRGLTVTSKDLKRILAFGGFPVGLAKIASDGLMKVTSKENNDAGEGHFGHGHHLLHEDFYTKIVRPDTGTSCCSGEECRPTSGRTVNDHYEVKINGVWVPVPWNKIVLQAAPDFGYHVCAPANFNVTQPHQLFCVILPPES
jgi:hypothetical protein